MKTEIDSSRSTQDWCRVPAPVALSVCHRLPNVTINAGFHRDCSFGARICRLPALSQALLFKRWDQPAVHPQCPYRHCLVNVIVPGTVVHPWHTIDEATPVKVLRSGLIEPSTKLTPMVQDTWVVPPVTGIVKMG